MMRATQNCIRYDAVQRLAQIRLPIRGFKFSATARPTPAVSLIYHYNRNGRSFGMGSQKGAISHQGLHFFNAHNYPFLSPFLNHYSTVDRDAPLVLHRARGHPRHRHLSPLQTTYGVATRLLSRCFRLRPGSFARGMAERRGGTVRRGRAASSATHPEVGTDRRPSPGVSTTHFVRNTNAAFPLSHLGSTIHHHHIIHSRLTGRHAVRHVCVKIWTDIDVSSKVSHTRRVLHPVCVLHFVFDARCPLSCSYSIILLYPFPGDFFTAAFQCPHRVERAGTLGDGGKWVCGLERVAKQRQCVIYSFGPSLLPLSPCPQWF